MLSAVISSAHSYPAPTPGGITGTPEVRLFRSSRTRKRPFSALTPTPDTDRTVSRRSEPSSRAAFMGEQTNPWDVLPPQDATSRHRGAKPPRRYELLGEISLLSPEYLLSDERRPFHSESAGSLGPTFVPARAISLAVRRTCTFPLYARLLTALSAPSRSSVTF